jgi:hypothetical protein
MERQVVCAGLAGLDGLQVLEVAEPLPRPKAAQMAALDLAVIEVDRPVR